MTEDDPFLPYWRFDTTIRIISDNWIGASDRMRPTRPLKNLFDGAQHVYTRAREMPCVNWITNNQTRDPNKSRGKGFILCARRPYRVQTSASLTYALKDGEGEERTFIAFRGKMSVRERTDACGRWTNIKNDADELSDNSFEITIRDVYPRR